MDAVQAFANEARRFEQWARLGTDSEETGAREALTRVLRLYGAALELPPPWSEGPNTDEPERVDHSEWQAVAAAVSRLPLNYYGELSDPLPVPPGQPGIGSLVDDLADIYRDVVTGLRLYDAGRNGEAVWQWAFNFRVHWGDHATGAIRALHCWLAVGALGSLGTRPNTVAR